MVETVVDWILVSVGVYRVVIENPAERENANFHIEIFETQKYSFERIFEVAQLRSFRLSQFTLHCNSRVNVARVSSNFVNFCCTMI